MFIRTKKIAVAASLVGLVGLGTAPSAFATSTLHLSPASTAFTGHLKTGTDVAATATVDGFAITATCTKLSLAGKTPADGLSVALPKSPTISGCTDSLGGTDTVTTNSTNGKWKVTWASASKATITMPKAGVTLSSTLLPGCVITEAPTAAVKLTGTYNNINTVTITNAKVPGNGPNCGGNSTGTFSMTVTLTPQISVVS